METAICAIMSVYPLDDFDPDPVRVMMPVDDPDRVPDVQRAVLAEIERAAGRPVTPGKLSRPDFIARRRRALASYRSATAAVTDAS